MSETKAQKVTINALLIQVIRNLGMCPNDSIMLAFLFSLEIYYVYYNSPCFPDSLPWYLKDISLCHQFYTSTFTNFERLLTEFSPKLSLFWIFGFSVPYIHKYILILHLRSIKWIFQVSKRWLLSHQLPWWSFVLPHGWSALFWPWFCGCSSSLHWKFQIPLCTAAVELSKKFRCSSSFSGLV